MPDNKFKLTPHTHFTLFASANSPLGNAVLLVLHELGLDYEPIFLDLKTGEPKSEEFTKYNPNGRIPVLIDHYVDKYDPDLKISVAGNDKYVMNQWLLFQATGQSGPFWNWAYFSAHNAEKIPTVIAGYKNEVVRVLGVLEKVLSKQEWLVGSKLTVADLVFLPSTPPSIPDEALNIAEFDVEKNLPAVYKWHNAMASRSAAQKVLKLALVNAVELKSISADSDRDDREV